MPSSASPLAELLADLQHALGGLGVRWYLFGAQAAILHGVARLTADVDVTVDAAARSNGELVRALSGRGFDLRVSDSEGFIESTRVLPMVHRSSRLPVDVVLAGPGLEELFFSRIEERSVGDVRVPVASAEDVVTMKVLAGRPKDIEDVVAIAQARRLDVERVRATLRLIEEALNRADLVRELDRALARAGPEARRGRP